MSKQYPFWFGGSASCMAACVTHPLELIKVRMQARAAADAPATIGRTLAQIFRQEGLLSLYTGLSASILRQLTYATVRFAVYEDLKARASGDAGVAQLVGFATVSGFLGGVAGNVADVLNVRMQNDGTLPVGSRRNYKHAVDGMIRMTKEEGIKSWFRGWLPNSTRAAVQTASQLVSYDVFKHVLIDSVGMEDQLPCHLTASFLAGAMAATVTNPVDVVKTTVMSSTQNQGAMTAISHLSQKDGLWWIFRGWGPSFLRVGP